MQIIEIKVLLHNEPLINESTTSCHNFPAYDTSATTTNASSTRIHTSTSSHHENNATKGNSTPHANAYPTSKEPSTSTRLSTSKEPWKLPIDSNPSINYFSFLNIQGLSPKTIDSKTPYLKDILKPSNQIFIGLSETWLKDHLDAELAIDGYTIFRSDRRRQKKSKRGRDSGGTAFYVRDDIADTFEKLVEFSNGVVEIIALYSKTENLVISTVYHLPDNSTNGYPSRLNEFQD